MVRAALCVVLALIGSVQVPALAWARVAPPQDIDARADALFRAGKPLEAAKLFAQALNDLPEGPDTRDLRNSWASGAVNAYRRAFVLDTTQCATNHAGLALADAYLADLVEVYGEQARDGDDFDGMRRQRDLLDQTRTGTRCPEPASVAAPTTAGGQTATRDEPADEQSGPAQTEPIATRRRGPGLAVGIGVSTALTVGMAIGTGILYSQLRKGGGRYYTDIQDAAAAAGMPITDEGYDMCKTTSGHPDLATACQRWDSRHKAFLATAVLTGVFAATTAVFTGLLIRQRRQAVPAVALLRRHRAQLGAMPHRGGGASLTAGFQF